MRKLRLRKGQGQVGQGLVKVIHQTPGILHMTLITTKQPPRELVLTCSIQGQRIKEAKWYVQNHSVIKQWSQDLKLGPLGFRILPLYSCQISTSLSVSGFFGYNGQKHMKSDLSL